MKMTQEEEEVARLGACYGQGLKDAGADVDADDDAYHKILTQTKRLRLTPELTDVFIDQALTSLDPDEFVVWNVETMSWRSICCHFPSVRLRWALNPTHHLPGGES